MANLIKESHSNIYRHEIDETSQEKNTERDYQYNLSQINAKSNQATSDSSVNVCESSIFYEGNLKTIFRNEQEYQRPQANQNIETSSLYQESEISSHQEESKNFINFFSLPKFGLCERSTQTMLTCRDLDDLEYLQKELFLCRTDLMSYVFKNKSNEYLKKIFPFADERKFNSGNNLTLPEIYERKENFINIKRGNDSDLEWIKSSHKSEPSVKEDTDSVSPYPNSHIHIKQRQQKGGRKKKKVEDQIRKDLEDSKEPQDVNMNENIKEFTTHPTQSTKTSFQTKTLNRDFSEEFDLNDIINEIKNSSRTDQFKKQDTNSTHSHKTNDHLNNLTFSNSSMKNESQFKKIHQPRKWDAFQYFKAEFTCSHKELNEDELDKMSRKEWNALDKDLKKIYNMNAERERKNHKLKKKIQREQLQKVTQSEDDIRK